MNWWYRNVFIDRNMSLTSEINIAKGHTDMKTQSNFIRPLAQMLGWLSAKVQANFELRANWKVYKNLSNDQLEDIGMPRNLTPEDLKSVLSRKTPLLSESMTRVTRKTKTALVKKQIMRDSSVHKKVEFVGNTVCSNDCIEHAA